MSFGFPNVDLPPDLPPPPPPADFPGERGPGPGVFTPRPDPVFGEGVFDEIIHAFLCGIGQQPLFGPPCDQGSFGGDVFDPPPPPVVVAPPVVVQPPMPPGPVLADGDPDQGAIARVIGRVFGSPVLHGPTTVDLPEPRQTEGEGGVLPHTFPGASVGNQFPRSY